MASTSPRQYDIVLYGASGYTGKLTAEQITLELPTDVNWALAGRSAGKLEAIAAELKGLSPNRAQPAIEPCTLDPKELDALAKKTRLIISIVGPYSQYGEGIFRACAENGTHYVDVTGEVPWVAAMIQKYETKAKATGAIMIPQSGLDSTPADLIALVLVETIREKLKAPTKEVVISIHDTVAAPSGGSINTILSLMDVFTQDQVDAAQRPYALSPIPGPKSTPSLLDHLFGVRIVRDLGTLATSIGGLTDEPIVQRTWGLLSGSYGPNFQVREMGRARNLFTAVLMHWAITLGYVALGLPFLRRWLKTKVTQPGDGPTKDDMKHDYFEYRGIGVPDVEKAGGPRAFCKLKYMGPLYVFTGLSAAMAAISILRDDHKQLAGGIYTPAMLGQRYIDRLDAAGLKWEVKILED